MPIIMLDAGHRGIECREMYGGKQERDDNLRLALAVGDILTQYGIPVFYTRTSDVTMSWKDRVAIANETNADIMISFNHYINRDSRIHKVAETLIFEQNGLARETAENINNYLAMYNFHSHGIIEIQSQSVDICKLTMPLVILMVRYIDGANSYPVSDIRFNELSWAIAAGVLETFSYSLEEDVATMYWKKGVVDTMKDRKPVEFYEDRGVNNKMNNHNGSNMDNMNEQYDRMEQDGGMDQGQNDIDYRYRLQVGLFSSYENALQYQEQLFQDGFTADIVRQGEFYALHVGKFDDLDEAAVWERVLRMAGYNTLLISI